MVAKWTVSLSFFNCKLEQKDQSHQMHGFWKTQISSYLWKIFVTTVLSIKASAALLRCAVGWGWGQLQPWLSARGYVSRRCFVTSHRPWVWTPPSLLYNSTEITNAYIFLSPEIWNSANTFFFAHVSCSSEYLLNLLGWWDITEQSTLEHLKIANFFFLASPFSPH